MATIIAAHDLSGVGRCSLTTALAVLPAFGHTCYPLPTAILSQQTGFDGYRYIDMAPHFPSYISAWRDLNVGFDAVYTGFLSNGNEAELIGDFVEKYPHALVIVDPVMGDNSAVYECYDDRFVESMRSLARHANVVIPNATEFNLLVNRPAMQAFPSSHDEILALAGSLNAPRLEYIVITSGVAAGGMCNLLVDIKAGSVTEIPCYNSGVSYSGSGDLFASILSAMLLDGTDIKTAIKLAADFISDAVTSMPKDADTRYGIVFEPKLAAFANSYRESFNAK